MDKYLDEIIMKLQETGMSINDALYLVCCVLHEQSRAFIYWEDYYEEKDDVLPS